MKNTMILISGMPATGKTTFAEWLSKRLRAPLVCYDHILAKLSEMQPGSSTIPYEFFLFTVEENMRSSALFLADYIFSGKMTETLDRLTEKYDYQVLNIHMTADPETAYRRFVQRNAQDAESGKIRPSVSLEDFREATRQNREFLYGAHQIEVDTENFSRLSYERVYEAVREYLRKA